MTTRPIHPHDASGARMPTTDAHLTATRELARRENDGLAVVLHWHPRSDGVTVSVDDARTGDSFEFAVARERALQAFHHPFAYAA